MIILLIYNLKDICIFKLYSNFFPKHFYHTPYPEYSLHPIHALNMRIKKSNLPSASGSASCTHVVRRISWAIVVMGGNDLGRDIAFSWPSSCCCKIIPLGCHFAPSHDTTAGFSFYIALKVKHLTSPSRLFKASPSLQITYNSQRVSSLSPDRSLMAASLSLHLLAFQGSSFVSSLTLPARSSLRTSVKLPHHPPSHTMESSLWTGCLWQSPDNEAEPLLAVLPTLCPITLISALLTVSPSCQAFVLFIPLALYRAKQIKVLVDDSWALL